MKPNTLLRLLCLALLLVAGCLLLPAGPTRAQSGGAYDLTWSSVDAGGGMGSAGGAYTLSGSAGQPDAGWLTGDPYALAGGFWVGGLFERWVYLPLVLLSR